MLVPLGTKVLSDEVTTMFVTDRVESISATLKTMACLVSSKVMTRLVEVETVGASFTATTLKAKLEVAEVVPSVTWRLITLVPDKFALGVMVSVRLFEVLVLITKLPDNTRPEGSCSVAVAVTTKLVETVSESFTVNGTTNATSSRVVCAAIALMVGLVSKIKIHPPSIAPARVPVSSPINSFQSPFGLTPLNTVRSEGL